MCIACSGYDGKYKFGILPVSMFCSGHTYFTQRMPFKLGLDPYVVHATFQFSGTPGKRWRLREALLWDVRRPSPSCLCWLRTRPACLQPCQQGARHVGNAAKGAPNVWTRRVGSHLDAAAAL